MGKAQEPDREYFREFGVWRLKGAGRKRRQPLPGICYYVGADVCYYRFAASRFPTKLLTVLGTYLTGTRTGHQRFLFLTEDQLLTIEDSLWTIKTERTITAKTWQHWRQTWLRRA